MIEKNKLQEINSKILWDRTHYCGEISPELDRNNVVIYGWVHRIRDVGKLIFALIRDRTGIVQAIVKKNVLDDVKFNHFKDVRYETAIVIKGTVKTNPKAPKGCEILVSDYSIVNKATTPLPLDVTETVPAEFDTRFDNRPLDLRKPRINAIFIIQSSITNSFRTFFNGEGFIEVHTPKIVAEATEGGANVFRVKYFEKDAYLAQSPQLYKQLLLLSGFDKVFEIAPVYRAEEHNTPRHLNEYVGIDAEISWIRDIEDVMKILENVVYNAVKTVKEQNQKQLKEMDTTLELPKFPFQRITYAKALELLQDEGKEIPFGEDIDTEGERLLGKIMKEKYDMDLYFITHYPLEVRPFYTMPCSNNPDLTCSFDLEYKGLEITTGGQRIHDYNLLEEQIINKGLNPENFEFYTKFFKYGAPPHGGFGIGLERLTMQILGLHNIRETSLFPRTRTRVTP